MSTDIENVEGWDGPEPIGTCANGRLRWAPTWIADWPADERERLCEWCQANPAAIVTTDQGDRTVGWLLSYVEDPERTVDPLTNHDARMQFLAYGR